MLTQTQAKNLETHAVGIFHSFILPEITNDGYILVREKNGKVVPDPVTTHHLVEFCLEIDPDLTTGIIDNACSWFRSNDAIIQDPFFLTTLLSAQRFDAKERKVILNHILSNQRPSGFIDLYAGFLDGGSIFSTLWAVRLLSLLSKGKMAREASYRALNAIEKNWSDVHRTSFKGYYCELLWQLGEIPTRNNKTSRVVREICDMQESNGLWDGELLYTAYILGNLASYPSKPSKKISSAITQGFNALFQLDNEPTSVPDALSAAREHYVESTYLQLYIRSLVSATRYLRRFHGQETAKSLAASVFSSYPRTYQGARAMAAELKKMDRQYGEIHNRFSHLDEYTSAILSENPFDQNVFVMMPFRQERDERYEDIEKIIRNELKKHGYRAWLATDKTVAPQLWDNVASYLTACKYAIAIFTRLEKESVIEEEFNPNVSLELGFCISRGKRVLILKDIALRQLHTDLVGHLYEEFNLNNVKRQLPAKIRKWIRQIKEDEERANQARDESEDK